VDLLTWVRNEWDRVGAWVAIGVGALLIVLGWIGVSGTPLTPEQIPYVVSGGLGGLFLLGVGAMLWLSADLRDEWRLLEELRANLDDAEPTNGDTVPGEPGQHANGDGAEEGPARKRAGRRTSTRSTP
jgi:hypothetical protein